MSLRVSNGLYLSNLIISPLPYNFASTIYNDRPGKHDTCASGENFMPQASQLAEKIKVMGDKSPKANQKKSGQKDAKTSSANQKKNAAAAAKSSAPKKK